MLQLHSLEGFQDFERVASLAPTLRRLVLLRQSATADAAHRIVVLIMQCRGLQVSLNPTAPRLHEGRFLLNTPSCCRQRQSSVTDPPGRSCLRLSQRILELVLVAGWSACSPGRLGHGMHGLCLLW